MSEHCEFHYSVDQSTDQYIVLFCSVSIRMYTEYLTHTIPLHIKKYFYILYVITPFEILLSFWLIVSLISFPFLRSSLYFIPSDLTLYHFYSLSYVFYFASPSQTKRSRDPLSLSFVPPPLSFSYNTQSYALPCRQKDISKQEKWIKTQRTNRNHVEIHVYKRLHKQIHTTSASFAAILPTVKTKLHHMW